MITIKSQVNPTRRIYENTITEAYELFVEIIRAARVKGIDLIIMGTHGRFGISHLKCLKKVYL